MWLKKLVGLSMLITLIGMNVIVLIGFFKDEGTSDPGFSLSQQAAAPVSPVVTLEAAPTEVQTGLFSALKWSVSGEITGCTASGDWTGPKTQFGSESTGRLGTEGAKTYTLTCVNDGGKDTKTVTVQVKQGAVASIPTPTTTTTTPTPTTSAPVYCGGASPCYGPREVSSHSGAGNCWGYNGDRVTNVTSLDAGYHKGKTGIDSIEVGGVCGKDLGPSLNGSVSAGGISEDHKSTTKSNMDRNLIPYLVGYYDAKKP